MKKALIFIGVIFLGFTLVACKKDDSPREVKTWLHWTFDDMDDGQDLSELTAVEGPGFKVVKDGGNGYITSKNPEDWAANYFGVSDEEGNEVFLKDFMFETAFIVDEEDAHYTNDGGLAINVGAAGRYDLAINYPANEEATSNVNVWLAGSTDQGPIASNDKEEWGEERGYVSDFELEIGKLHKFSILAKHSSDEEGNEFMQLYIYVDDILVISQKTARWEGGFGVRAWQSAMKYDYIKITDLPLVSPDGAIEFK